MKKIIKAILITGMCVSSVSSVSSVSRVLCEDGTISPCFPNKYEPISICDICDICDTFRSEKIEKVKLTKENLYELLHRVNKAAKTGEKVTVEKLLSELKVKAGYFYFILSFFDSNSGEYETFILGSNNSSIYDRIFILNLKQEGK
jgi:hypothetical protein